MRARAAADDGDPPLAVGPTQRDLRVDLVEAEDGDGARIVIQEDLSPAGEHTGEIDDSGHFACCHTVHLRAQSEGRAAGISCPYSPSTYAPSITQRLTVSQSVDEVGFQNFQIQPL